MLKFTSEADLLRLNSADPAYPIIEEFVHRLITEPKKSEFGYSPEADGYLVLLERDDVDRPLTEIWGADAYSLSEVPWEGVSWQDGFYVAVFLANNQFGLVFVIPDRDWLPDELRKALDENLISTPKNSTP
jgi:hypothetical protein